MGPSGWAVIQSVSLWAQGPQGCAHTGDMASTPRTEALGKASPRSWRSSLYNCKQQMSGSSPSLRPWDPLQQRSRHIHRGPGRPVTSRAPGHRTCRFQSCPVSEPHPGCGTLCSSGALWALHPQGGHLICSLASPVPGPQGSGRTHSKGNPTCVFPQAPAPSVAQGIWKQSQRSFTSCRLPQQVSPGPNSL